MIVLLAIPRFMFWTPPLLMIVEIADPALDTIWDPPLLIYVPIADPPIDTIWDPPL
jgi:hypothetical protein